MWCCTYDKCDCSWISDGADTQLFQGVFASHPWSQHNPEVQRLCIILCERQRHWQILEQQHASCIEQRNQTQQIGGKSRMLSSEIRYSLTSHWTSTLVQCNEDNKEQAAVAKGVLGRSKASAFLSLHRSKSGELVSMAASSWKHR